MECLRKIYRIFIYICIYLFLLKNTSNNIFFIESLFVPFFTIPFRVHQSATDFFFFFEISVWYFQDRSHSYIYIYFLICFKTNHYFFFFIHSAKFSPIFEFLHKRNIIFESICVELRFDNRYIYIYSHKFDAVEESVKKKKKGYCQKIQGGGMEKKRKLYKRRRRIQ